MTKLRDAARALISIAENEILRREKLIMELRKELEKAREELAGVKNQRRAIRSEKCKGCLYYIVATKVLEAEEKAKK